MPKCKKCDVKLPFNVATVTKLTEYCDDCESTIETAQETPKVRIVKGFEIEGPEADNIPEDVIEKAVEKLIARGLSPEEGVLFAGNSEDIKDKSSVSYQALQISFRDSILSAKGTVLSTIHEMMHTGKSRASLEGAIKLWSDFEAFCLTELLFDEKDIAKLETDFGFKITPENMTEKNTEVTLHCDMEH